MNKLTQLTLKSHPHIRVLSSTVYFFFFKLSFEFTFLTSSQGKANDTRCSLNSSRDNTILKYFVEDTNFSQQTAVDEFSDTDSRWPPRTKKSSAVKRYRAKLLLSRLCPVPSSPCPESLRHHSTNPSLSPQLQLCF